MYIYIYVCVCVYIYIYIYTLKYMYGVGNGDSLQYSCLRISGTEKPGRPQSMQLQRAGHN